MRIAVFGDIVGRSGRTAVVERLPKTRSGKILRQVLRKMVDGQPYVTPSTIDDPAIISEIESSLREHGVI